MVTARIIPNKYKYWEFIKELRFSKANINGFIGQTPSGNQKEYMQEYGDFYFICMLGNTPVGYFSVIKNDISFCVDGSYHGKGLGTFMLNNIKDMFPRATGQIKESNIASQKAFERAGIEYRIIPDDV